MQLEQLSSFPLFREALWMLIQNYNKRFGTHCVSSEEMFRHQDEHPENAALIERENAGRRLADVLNTRLWPPLPRRPNIGQVQRRVPK
jgi:hypothetical protein